MGTKTSEILKTIRETLRTFLDENTKASPDARLLVIEFVSKLDTAFIEKMLDDLEKNRGGQEK